MSSSETSGSRRTLWIGRDGAGSSPPVIALLLDGQARRHAVTFAGNER